MKNILTLLAIFFGLGLANAQTFDETVDYLNNFFKDNEVSYFPDMATGFMSDYLVSELKVEKNGKVSFINKTTGKVKGVFNLFEFEKFEVVNGSFLYLRDKNNNKIGNFSRFPSTHISKLENAFKHLRTLCVKEKDPFE